ncbi:MAG: amino acid ABC transporter substrate-binding protein, partial [Cyanobacteria bacterium J06641_5]
EAADANTGEGIQSKIREVANAPGKAVNDVCEALALLQEGEDIDYQGASSKVDLDENGDTIGSYDVWTIEASGSLDTVGSVTPGE